MNNEYTNFFEKHKLFIYFLYLKQNAKECELIFKIIGSNYNYKFVLIK